jgi:hypothetical protein
LGTEPDEDLVELGGLYCHREDLDEDAALASVGWQSLVSDTGPNPALDPTPLAGLPDLAPRGWCIHCHVAPVPPHRAAACDACAAANVARLGLAAAGGAE